MISCLESERRLLVLEVRVNQLQARRAIRWLHFLEVCNGSGGITLDHQEDAEVIVRIAIGGIEAKDGAKLFFSLIDLLLHQQKAAKIVVGLHRAGIDLERFLERGNRACGVLLLAENHSQQVVCLDALRIALQDFAREAFGFFHTILLHEALYLLEILARLRVARLCPDGRGRKQRHD